MAGGVANIHLHVPLVVLGFAGLLVPVFLSSKNRKLARCSFWLGLLIACVSAFFVAYPADSKLRIGMSLFVAAITIFTAYMSTPFIKIRGKIYAFHISDSQPEEPDVAASVSADEPDHDPTPDSYGGIATAQKEWWIFIIAATIFGWNIVIFAEDKLWVSVMSAVAFVALATGFGYGDASWGYKVARGQRLQFAIIALVTVGAFPLLYLPAYYAGRHWPLRRKQAMEYRAHPRHQKKYP
jgi:hypothetical protein